MMTRADIIQIIFGIHSDEMDTMVDLLRKNYNGGRSDCSDCIADEEDNVISCLLFWTEALTEDEWTDCVRRFTILYNTYCLGHNRGYLEGEKRQHELESEGKE